MFIYLAAKCSQSVEKHYLDEVFKRDKQNINRIHDPETFEASLYSLYGLVPRKNEKKTAKSYFQTIDLLIEDIDSSCLKCLHEESYKIELYQVIY